MAEAKRPVVLGAGGLLQLLQPGDNLACPISGFPVRQVTNGESSAALTICTPVYAVASDTVRRAQANAFSTSIVVGLWFDASTAAAALGYVQEGEVFAATTAQWDAVAGTSGGLVFNQPYFLSAAEPGLLTATPPTTVGQSNVLIGFGLSSTELRLVLNPPILL